MSVRTATAMDAMGWGSESIMEPNNTPSFCSEICPRVVRLIVVLPSDFIHVFFHQVLPTAARKPPEPHVAAYWTEVFRLLDAIPQRLDKFHSHVYTKVHYATPYANAPD
jgi:hypothetical protein